MAGISKLFRNRNFILVLSIAVGLAAGERVASFTRPAILPVLGLIMVLSTTSITSREFYSIKNMSGRILIALLLNFVVTAAVWQHY